MNRDKLQEIISSHGKWLLDDPAGRRANLCDANLRGANLCDANLCGADLRRANLYDANLRGADLCYANLCDANLCYANLRGADLRRANLCDANLRGANLCDANLRGADLRRANLCDADLRGAKNLVKIMSVEPGNFYWKAIGDKLVNMGYQFKLGLNVLPDGKIFANDDCVTCSYPGFHFASKSWCKAYYGERKYLCKIRIPEDAQINEPWATDGKASADKIEIVQVLLMKKEEDVTKQFQEVQGE